MAIVALLVSSLRNGDGKSGPDGNDPRPRRGWIAPAVTGGIVVLLVVVGIRTFPRDERSMTGVQFEHCPGSVAQAQRIARDDRTPLPTPTPSPTPTRTAAVAAASTTPSPGGADDDTGREEGRDGTDGAEREDADGTRKEPLASLRPDEPEGLVMTFNRARFARPSLFTVDLAAGDLPQAGTELVVQEQSLERQEARGEISPHAYVAYAWVSGPQQATVLVCMDSVKQRIDPGTYVGGVRVQHPGIENFTVPMFVSLQFREFEYWAVVFGIVVLVAGTFFVWSNQRRGTSEPVTPGAFARDVPSWLGANVVPVALGVLAAVSAWVASYWRNDSWGAKAPDDWFTLLGAMFGAYTAGLATGTGVKRAIEGPPDEEGATQEKGGDAGASRRRPVTPR